MTECMLWAFAKDADGYGVMGRRRAHRVLYEALVSPIPAGMHVLHQCDTPPCINLAHLFIGTNEDNVADMVAKRRHLYKGRGKQWSAKTYCPKGHEYTADNVRIGSKGQRHCRACDKLRSHHKTSDAPKPHQP